MLFCIGTLIPALLVTVILVSGAPIVGWEEPDKYLRISRGLLEHRALVEERPLIGEDVTGGASSAERVIVPALERLPAYPVFVAAIWSLGWPGSYVWVVVIQCLLGGMFAVAMAASAQALRPAWLWPAGLLACLWPNVQWQATIVMPEMLLVTTLAVGIAAALCLPMSRRPWWTATVAALGFGIAFLTKPQLLLLPVTLGPALWWYLVSKGVGRRKAAALAAIPVATMLFLAGLQVNRVHNSYGAFMFTTHSNDHALFFAWPCLSSSFGCGDPNLTESARALAAFRDRTASLTEAQKADPILLNQIKGELFREFVAGADKAKMIQAIIGSYVKLMLHTVVLSAVERFGGTLLHLTTTTGEGVQRLANFASRVAGEPGMLFWMAAQVTLLASRLIQGIGLFAGLYNSQLRSACVLIAVIAATVLITSAGIGNPRYRVAAEPTLLLLTVIGIDLMWHRFAGGRHRRRSFTM